MTSPSQDEDPMSGDTALVIRLITKADVPGFVRLLVTDRQSLGGNWEGGAYDPDTGMLYIASMTQVQAVAMTPRPMSRMTAVQSLSGFSAASIRSGI